jgi:hypothetical protein
MGFHSGMEFPKTGSTRPDAVATTAKKGIRNRATIQKTPGRASLGQKPRGYRD